MSAHPTTIQRVGDRQVQISWSDGQQRVYAAAELRERCPCATCRENRTAPARPPTELTVLAPEETRPTEITGMKPVGNYAYAIAFSDGHDTGIFTFELLRSLGEATMGG